MATYRQFFLVKKHVIIDEWEKDLIETKKVGRVFTI
jgi:hypothetical protein